MPLQSVAVRNPGLKLSINLAQLWASFFFSVNGAL